MQAPRLLMICERFPPDVGGLARSGHRLAQGLARVGAEVHVLAWTRTLPAGALQSITLPPETASEPGSGAVHVHRVGLYANFDLSLQHTMNVLEWLQGEVHARAVWGHYLFPAGFVATLFAGGAGLPVTVSARGNDVDRLTFPPGDFARLLFTLERADLVTAVSRDLERKIRVLAPRAATRVLPNAVDPALYAPGPADPALRARLGIQDGEQVLGFSGELRHKKGLAFLLDALRAVRRTRPACLLVVGEVRPSDQARLLGFAAEDPGAAARIVVTGHLEEPADVAAHLRLCDVVLQPSLWEGMPNALLEAMACALPCVASDAGGIPELVEHGRSGVLVPRAQLHRFGEAVQEILDAPPERRAALGAAARARILEGFDLAAEAAALRQILAQLVPSDR